ncbi:PH domain-containing protein [Blastococcus montanus]|uniref:PH domain-containing protein n=1 Tax=Blastococcus montanus TaxID=3144973 RepID=UPI00320B99B8
MTAVPSPVREPAWSLSRSAIGLWVTESVISTVFLWLAIGAFLLFVPADVGGPIPVLRWLLPLAGLAYAVVAIGIRPWVRHRIYRWEITAEAAYTRTGWLTQTWTLVPISRIQTVDVTRGVLQQMFGLASVAVLTASSQGTVHIAHLDHDVAQRVAGDLAHRAELVRDQAT